MKKITIIKRRKKEENQSPGDKSQPEQTQDHAILLAGEDAQTVMRSGCKNNEDK